MTPSDRLSAEIEADMTRALAFGQLLDSLFVETPNQRWLRDAADPLRRQREDGEEIHKPGKSAKLRLRLRERDGNNCWFCGEVLGFDESIEHLTPRAEGGSDDLDNLVLCHVKCNRNLRALPRHAKEAARKAMQAEHGEAA